MNWAGIYNHPMTYVSKVSKGWKVGVNQSARKLDTMPGLFMKNTSNNLYRDILTPPLAAVFVVNLHTFVFSNNKSVHYIVISIALISMVTYFFAVYRYTRIGFKTFGRSDFVFKISLLRIIPFIVCFVIYLSGLFFIAGMYFLDYPVFTRKEANFITTMLMGCSLFGMAPAKALGFLAR